MLPLPLISYKTAFSGVCAGLGQLTLFSPCKQTYSPPDTSAISRGDSWVQATMLFFIEERNSRMFPPNKFLTATLCGLCVFSPPIPPGQLSPRVSGYQAPTLPAPELLLLLCKMTAIWAGGLSVATTFQPPSHLPSLGSHSPDPSEQDQTGFGSCSPRSGAGTAEERLLESRLPSGTFSQGLRLSSC